MKRRIVLILIILAVVIILVGGVYWFIKQRDPSTLLARAEVALRAGNLEKAADLASQYIETNPDDWHGYHLLARVYARQGRYEEARKRLEELRAQEQKLKPDMYLVMTLLADTYSYPAKESLETAESATQISLLESAIEQIRKGNEILSKITDPNSPYYIEIEQIRKDKEIPSDVEISEKRRALDVKEGIAVNKAFMGEYLFLIAERYDKEAKTAEAVGNDKLSQERKKQQADTEQEAKQVTQEAIRIFLEVVSQDASRSISARTLAQLCIRPENSEFLSAAREAILPVEDANPIAKMMLLVHEFSRSYKKGEYVQAESEAEKAKILKFAQSLDALLEKNPNEEQILIQRSKLAYMLSDLSLAERLVQKVLENNPRQAQAKLLEAKIMQSRGDMAEAERKLFSLKAEYPRWPEAHLAFGEVALAMGNKGLARQAMRRVTELDPDNSRARGFLAESLLREGFSDLAFIDAQVYYQAHPDDSIALRLYVESSVRTNHIDKARVALDKTKAEHSSDPTLMYTAAVGYARIGNKEQMLACARLAADSSPITFQDRLAVTQAMILLDRTAEAEKLLLEDLSKESQPPRLHYALGEIYAKTGRNLQAIERFSEAVRLDNDNEQYRLSLARVYWNIGEVDECQKTLEGISHTNARANFLRLQIKLIQGESIESDEALQQVGSSGSLAVAMAYLNSGNPNQCIAICETQLTQNPEDTDMRGLLGQAYLALGQKDKCYEQWEKLLELSPGQYANYLRLARLLIRDIPVSEVVSKLATISEAKPELIEVTKGWLYQQTGQPDMALEVYKNLSVRSEVSQAMQNKARLTMAEILAQQRKWKEAIAVLDGVSHDSLFQKRAANVFKARLLIADQQLPQAEVLLETLRADAKKQRNTAVLRRVAESYVIMKKNDEALAVCDDIKELLPKDPDTYLLRASVLTVLDRQAEAIQSYRKAINCQPGRLGIYSKLALALDNWQEPLEALVVLDELEKLNDAGRLRALLERSTLFNRWGLDAQAVECYEQMAASGHGDNPKIRLYLGRALARLGRKTKASEMLREIPEYASEYAAAQLLLANLAEKTEEKLEILQRLQTTDSAQINVLTARMTVLLTAERADECLTVFRSFLKDYPETKPLPAQIRPLALQAILHAEDQESALSLVRDLASRQEHQGWLFVAILLMADKQPEAAAKLLPKDISKGNLYDALLGIYLAYRIENPEAAQQWFKRIKQMDEEGSKLEPPKRIPGPYKILLHLARGAIEPAEAELEQFRDNKIIAKSAAIELVEYAAANVKMGQTESRELLKVFVAFDLAAMKLSRTWALELLKNRPTCQWAASLILASGVDESILREVQTILEPKNCSLARRIKAHHLMQTEEFTRAAALYSQLAQYQQDPTRYLLQQGTALENAGKFSEALEVYQRVWESSKNPVAANNAAYLVSELVPQDKVKLAEARNWIDEAVSTSPGVWVFRDTKGWISFLQGDQEEACKELRRAIKGLPDSLEVHYHLGAVEAAQGNSKLARWHLEAAIQLGQTRKNEGKTLTPAEVKALERAGEALTKIEPEDREPTSENK